ncbi:MAG: sulfotransferase [Phycisphaerales bacterium JB052]
MNSRDCSNSIPRSPDFLCVGAQKAATSWLHCSLIQQTGIFLPVIKELHYFRETSTNQPRWASVMRRSEAARLKVDYPCLRYLRDHHRVGEQLEHCRAERVDDAWYRQVFSFARAGDLCGEVCPTYFKLTDHDIQRVNALSPQVRVVMLIRDPVDRCWSNIRMRKKRLGDNVDIDQLFRTPGGLKNFLDNSDYERAISRWKGHMGDRLRLFLYDDIAERPNEVFRQALEHIGYTREPDLPAMGKVNVGKPAPMPDAYRARLFALLQPQYDLLTSMYPERVAQWRSVHERALRGAAC